MGEHQHVLGEAEGPGLLQGGLPRVVVTSHPAHLNPLVIGRDQDCYYPI